MKNHLATPPALQDFQALVAHANMAIFLGDTYGNTLFANKAASDMFGYSVDELLLLHRDDLFNKEDDKYINGFNSRTPGKAFHGEVTGIRKGGERFPCEVFSIVFTDAHNQLRASTSIIDISKKVQAEQQALLSQQNLSLLLNNTEESFFLIDEKLQIISFNDTTATGLKNNLHIDIQTGASFLEVIEPERREPVRAICKEVLNGHTHTAEVKVTGIDGHTITLKSYFKPARNEKGDIAGIIVCSTNITEQKAALEQLKQTEQRWRFALEGSNHGVWDWNIPTGEIYFSTAWRRIFGYEENDITYTNDWWQQHIHPDDRPKVQGDISQHFVALNVLYETEYRFRHKDGSYKWIHSRGMIIEKDIYGHPLRMIGTHTDITEKKNIEENYRLLFHSNPLPMWTYDIDTFQFINVNDAAIKHYGYSKEEFLAMTVNDIRPPEDIAWLEKVNQQDRNKEQINQQYVRHIKKNGELIYVNITGNIVELQGRKVALILSEDVTEKLKAEEDLKRSKQQYEVLFYNNPLPSFIYDKNTLQIVDVNNAALQHYGYSREEFTQLMVTHLWSDEDVVRFLEHMQQNKNLKQLAYNHIKHKKKDGTTFSANVNSNNIYFNQKDCRLTVVNDISAIIAAQEQLKRSNDRFKYAAKASSEALWEWDVATNMVFNSPAYNKIFGYNGSDDIKLKEWEHLLYPDDKEETISSFYSALYCSHTKRWAKEYRYRKADGSYAYVLDKAYILRDEHGKPQRIIGAMKDISAQKYQQQLTELELKIFEINASKNKTLPDIINELLKGIETLHPHLKGSALLLTQKNNKHHFIAGSLPREYVSVIDNASFLLSSPYTKALHLNQPVIIEDLSTDADFPFFSGAAEKAGIKAGWFIPISNNNKCIAGVFGFYYSQAQKPTQSEWNTLIKLRNLLRILIENHATLQDLKESNERFDQAMRATHDLIWDWDFETGKIYRDPKGLKEVYGIYENNDNISLEAWRTHLHPDDYERVVQIAQSIFESKDLDDIDLEYRFLKDDGTYAYIYDRGTIIRNSDGKPYRMIGAAQNITRRKQLEHELLQKELDRQKEISQASIDMQEQERAEIGKELHDNVNQVLTTTKLYLDLALNNPELKDELIDKSNKNVLYVINEIRQLSRSLMNPSIGDLGLTDAVLDLTESFNVTRKLRVTFAADKSVEKLLSENQKLMLYRIIQEALNNAVKHAHANKVLITLHHRKSWIELVIEDDGKGFNTGLVKRGAGLNNIQNRVYLTNGSFTIESEPDKGCKLKINLPTNKLEINPT